MRPWLLALALSAACVWRTPAPVEVDADPQEAPSTAQAPSTPPIPELPAEHGLTVVERWTGGAQPGDDVPIVVAVHGLGDSAEHFAWLMESYPEPARVVLPQGPTPFGPDGFAWMTLRTRDARPQELAAQVDQAAARVAALCRDLGQDGRKPVLTGFSQGGMVSWTVAVRHPDTIAAAVPLSGYLPTPLAAPPEGRSPAPIHALHGDADRVVPLKLAREGQQALAAQGHQAELTAYPGVQHRIPRPVRARLYQELQQASSTR